MKWEVVDRIVAVVLMATAAVIAACNIHNNVWKWITIYWVFVTIKNLLGLITAFLESGNDEE